MDPDLEIGYIRSAECDINLDLRKATRELINN